MQDDVLTYKLNDAASGYVVRAKRKNVTETVNVTETRRGLPVLEVVGGARVIYSRGSGGDCGRSLFGLFFPIKIIPAVKVDYLSCRTKRSI